MLDPRPYCTHCTRFRPVPGVGPSDARLIFLAEHPGWEEHKRLVPMIGKQSRDFNGQYLPLAGISRDDVFIDNAMCCMPSGDADKVPLSHIHDCAAKHLPRTLRDIQPDAVVAMGAKSLSVFGPYSLEMEHGLPLPHQEYGGWTGTVFPTYHPAAGSRDARYMIELQTDFRNLWLWRKGRLTRPVDQHPSPDYRELLTPDDLVGVLRAAGAWDRTPGAEVAIDTETDSGRIWCLTFSLLPGTGYMISADNPILLRAFAAWLTADRPMVLTWNWLFDGPILRQAGITGYRFTDLMIRAYHMGNVPQALKVAAYRHLGMTMQDYDDLVNPYSRQAMLAWLTDASTCVVEEHVASLPWKQKVKKCSGGKLYGGKHLSCPVYFDSPDVTHCVICGKPLDPGPMERDKGGKRFPWDRATGILTDCLDNASTDPYARWQAIPPADRAMIESRIGPPPVPSINLVPRRLATHYACRDADATLRMSHIWRTLASKLGHTVRRGV